MSHGWIYGHGRLLPGRTERCAEEQLAEHDRLIDSLNAHYADQSKVRGGPKYERLYQAILSAIRKGVLSPGDRLPPEQVLSKHLPLSQVTVRKCFTLLAQRGVISREHGRGTFVSAAEQGFSDLWHFRFKDPDREGFMPIYNRILSRTIQRNARIAQHLSNPKGRFVCIERAVNIGSRFNCYSEPFLPADRFARHMDEPVAELERINLKDILAREFRTPTLRVDQNVRIEAVPERASETMGVSEGSRVLFLGVTGYTFDDQPISYQRIWIPETSYELNMPASAETVAQRHAAPPLKAVATG